MVTRMVNCGSTWAVCSKAVLDGAQPAVVYGGSDGLFTILEVDRGPREDDMPACLDCVLDLAPNLGRGLDVAKQHGVAYWIDGDWREKNVELLKAYPASKDGGTP